MIDFIFNVLGCNWIGVFNPSAKRIDKDLHINR